MTSRRKSLAALLAAVAVAVAAPTASASAATSTPAVSAVPVVGLSPDSLPCRILVHQLQFAAATGQTALVNLIGRVLLYACPNPAI